jgi:hypothetical protein
MTQAAKPLTHGELFLLADAQRKRMAKVPYPETERSRDAHDYLTMGGALFQAMQDAQAGRPFNRAAAMQQLDNVEAAAREDGAPAGLLTLLKEERSRLWKWLT